MLVTLYKNKSANNVVNKDIEDIAQVNAKIKDSASVSNFEIIIGAIDKETITKCNYLYCARMKRYYYITDMEMICGHETRVNCHVDVLKSFYDGFKNCDCIAERNENSYNLYYNDGNLPTLAYNKTITKRFPNGFTYGNYDYVLTIVGGGKDGE